MSSPATMVVDLSRPESDDGSDGGTPYGNTGVLTPQYASNCATDSGIVDFEAQASDRASAPGGLLLDYLRVRVTDNDQVRAELGEWLGPMTDRGCGWRNWYDRSASVLEGGIVAWCEDQERGKRQGVLVDLPGKACACLGDRLGPFLAWALAHGGVTRADFALDDREGRVTLERIQQAVQGGTLVTRWRAAPRLVAGMGAKGFEGWTVYMGRRESMAMLRIYDKAAQQHVDGPWVRVELELHVGLADAVCREYLARGNEAVIGQLNRQLHFAMKVETDDQRARWPWAPWWAELVGSVKPGPSLLAGEKPEFTVERAEAWLLNQVAPNFALVMRAKRLMFVQDLDKAGRERFTAKHYAALVAYRHRVGAPAPG